MITVYHLAGPDGRHYYLNTIKLGWSERLLVNGQEPTPATRSGWITSTEEITDWAKELRGTIRTNGYRLHDPEAASTKYPAELSVDDYNDRTDDGDDEDAPEVRLYEPITETTPGTIEPLTITVQHLDGEPAPTDGRTWTAQLPYELSQHTELLHLFPGRMTGFRDAVRLRLDAELGGHDYFGAPNGCKETSQLKGLLTAWRTVEYSPRQTEFVHNKGVNGNALKSGRNRNKTTKLEIDIQVPAAIDANTRAEAAAAWDAEMERIVALVKTELEPVVCWHCKGKGVVRESESVQQRRESALTAGSVADAERLIEAAKLNIRELWRAGVERLADRGATPAEVLAWLKRQGCDDQDARKIVAAVVIERGRTSATSGITS